MLRDRALPVKKKSFRQLIPLYIMILPGALYLLINNYLPLAGLVVAFKRYNYGKGIFGSDWAGFQNFVYLFKSTTAFIITRNTILYNLAFIVVGTVVAVTAAILLNAVSSRKAIKVYQTSILLPHVISMIIVSYLVFAFFSSDSGLINKGILPLMGLKTVSWYNEPRYWPFILIFVNTWKTFGFQTIIYYASVISIEKDYYEAAGLDGAGRMKQIRYITLPMLQPVIIMMVLLAVGRIFYSDFALFYQVTQNSGALYDTTNVIDTYVYRAMIQLGDVGMASAAGAYQSVVGFVMVLLTNLLVRRVSPENALF